MSEKIDKIRIELARSEAALLSKKYARFFNNIPNLNSFSSRDLRAFKCFLSPPLDIERINKKRSKPHYLLFICDVLERVILMHQVIKSNTSFSENGELNRRLELFAEIAHFFKAYFEKKSQKYHTLSVNTFISFLQQNSGASLSREEKEHQIKRATNGLVDAYPVYASLFDPYIFDPKPDSKIFLSNHALIAAAIWNAHFWVPDRLHAISSIAREVRKVMTAPFLKNGNHLIGYSTTGELIEELQKHTDFSRIVYYLLKLYRDDASLQGNGRGNAFGNHSTGPRPHYRYVKVSSTEIEHFFDDEHEITLIREKNTTSPDEGVISELDVARDELIDDEFVVTKSEEEQFSVERQAITTNHAINHIEKYNQNIVDPLTQTELIKIVKILEAEVLAPAKPNPQNELNRLAAICQIAIGLFTGRSIRKPYRIQYLKIGQRPSSKIINVTHDFTHLIAPLFYVYKSITESQRIYYRSDEQLELMLPSQIKSIIETAITKWLVIKNEITLQTGATPTEPYIIADKVGLKNLLDKAKLDQRVTPAFISNAIRSIFYKQANGDYWSAAVISDSFLVISATQHHYTTVINGKIYRIYKAGVEELFSERVAIPSQPHAKQYKGIGNPIRPVKSIITNELNHLSHWLRQRLHNDYPGLPNEELISIFNCLMLFFETYSSFFNGARDVTNPYIARQQIDQNGFAILADKVIKNGYNTRTVFILEALRDIQVRFEDHIRELMLVFISKKLIKQSDFFAPQLQCESGWRGLNQTHQPFPGFVLISPDIKTKKGNRSKIKLVPYTRSRAKKIYEQSQQFKQADFLQLVPNANRHFLRSSLLERGLNPEYVDELMGHRHFGTESWNRCSLFNPLDFQKNVKELLYQLHKDFNVATPFNLEDKI